MTDEAVVYESIGKEYAFHGTVNHSADEYVRKAYFYTNTIEAYFAILKRGITGSFHSVSEQHLFRYLGEFDYRWNTRKWDDGERSDELLRRAKGKRLMYSQTGEASYA